MALEWILAQVDIETEEFIPRALGDLSIEERLEVVPIQMDLEGLVARIRPGMPMFPLFR